MQDELKQKIRNFIEREVFVLQGKERIIPETSSWIMDFRRVCLDSKFLDAYTELFYEQFKNQYPFQVGGMEVAAIPLVSAIVMKMRERGMPVNGFFIRKSRKKTGLLKMIEGKLTNDPVILVDDLINNGYTLDRQLAVMQEANKKVNGFFTLLRFRPLSNYQKYRNQGVAIDAVFGLDDFTSSLKINLLKTESVPEESFVLKWRFQAIDAKLEAVVPKSGAVFDEERIYFGSDRGVLYALDRKDGSVVWQYQIGLGPWGSKRDKEIFSTPVLFEGRVYFGAYDGNVYCLDARTGKRLFVSFEADWISGSLALSVRERCLYVPTVFGLWHKAGGMVALDLKTGKVCFRKRFTGAVRSAPLVVEDLKKIFVTDEEGKVHALEIPTGRECWNFQSEGAIKDGAIYDPIDQTILFTSFDGSIYKLEAATGLITWRFETGLPNYSAPYLWQDRVFFCSLDKTLYCLDSKTGKKLWSFPARARIFSSPRVYNGRLYFGANDARMYEIDPQTGKQTGFFQAVERITNPVIFDPQTKDFYLQTYANEILCLKQKE